MQESQKRNQLHLQTPLENQLVFSFQFEASETDAGDSRFAVSYASANGEVNFASNLSSVSNSSSSPVSASNPTPNHSEISSSQIRAVAKANSGWPVGVPLPAGYSVYNFEKFRPQVNLFREYQVS